MTQQVPLAEFLLHPPLGAMQRELITGLVSGSADFTRDTGALAPFNHVNAYGLTWTFFTVPVGFGFVEGSPVVYDERMVQASTIHTDFLGHEIVSEYHAFQVEGIYWIWANPGPTRVHVEVAPGVEAQFYWIIVKIP